MDLLLQENPFGRKSRRRYNPMGPMGFDELGNPIIFGNPRRRKMARRHRNVLQNPIAGAAGAVKGWTQGVGVMDAVAGVGGLALAYWLPGMIIKTADTTTKKVLKVVMGVVAAGGAGYLANAVGGKRLGQAAVIGGLAGTAAQALGTFTNIKIGRPNPMLGPVRIGYPEMVSPSFTREGENVVLLQP